MAHATYMTWLVTFVLSVKSFRNQNGLKRLSLQQVFDKLFVWRIGFLSTKLDELLVGIALKDLMLALSLLRV